MKRLALVIVLLLTMPLHAAANDVSKITLPISIKDGGQHYSQITVTCENIEQPVLIRKNHGATLWCVDVQDNLCSRQKVRAAKLACRSDNVRIATAAEKTESVELIPAEAEQVQTKKYAQTEKDRFELEAELINIRQKELELRRQALELKKRKLSGSELTSG